MEPKLFYISCSTEIHDNSGWLKEFRKNDFTVTDEFEAADYIVFVGDWINEHKWNKATQQNKQRYNLCELSTKKALEMLNILLANT